MLTFPPVVDKSFDLDQFVCRIMVSVRTTLLWKLDSIFYSYPFYGIDIPIYYDISAMLLTLQWRRYSIWYDNVANIGIMLSLEC